MTWAEKIHTEMWYCDICHGEPQEFDEKESFVAHLKTAHGNQLTKSKLDGRARRNKRVAKREPLTCPLCDCVPDGLKSRTQDQLWHHIAAHLKSLAFLSLPYVDDNVEGKDSIAEQSASDDRKDATISRDSLNNWDPKSFDDIPKTEVLENGVRTVDGQEFAREPPPLPEPQDWTLLPLNIPQPDFELLGRKLQGPDNLGQTLSWAAENGDEATVRQLLDKGADVEKKDRYNDKTPLLLAAANGHEATVQLLLEKGADVEMEVAPLGQTSLWLAATNGHEGVVQRLLEKGADVKARHRNTGRTPLLRAAENGHGAVIKRLLEKGAEDQMRDGDSGALLEQPLDDGFVPVPGGYC